MSIGCFVSYVTMLYLGDYLFSKEGCGYYLILKGREAKDSMVMANQSCIRMLRLAATRLFFGRPRGKIHSNSVLFSFQQSPVGMLFFSFGMLGILEKSFFKKKFIRLYYLNVLVLA